MIFLERTAKTDSIFDLISYNTCKSSCNRVLLLVVYSYNFLHSLFYMFFFQTNKKRFLFTAPMSEDPSVSPPGPSEERALRHQLLHRHRSGRPHRGADGRGRSRREDSTFSRRKNGGKRGDQAKTKCLKHFCYFT